MKNSLPFHKLSGAGNDFIIIDGRNGDLPLAHLADLARAICRRKLSVGADGLIVIDRSENADFKWHFFNADGSVADMCGNGARCAARFAFLNGIAGARMRFETGAGLIEAQVTGDQVRVLLTPPHSLVLDISLRVEDMTLRVGSINTGVPHVVAPVENIAAVDVFRTGRALRHHEHFAPQGANVNFVQLLENQVVAIRTYERGVEDETMACGTGATAAALVLHHTHGLTSPVSIRTRSNAHLKIHFTPVPKGFEEVYLEGDARIIYQGELQAEAWNDIMNDKLLETL